MKQWMNKILLSMLILLLVTFPASAKICTTTLLYCADGTNNCNKVTCFNETVYNSTFDEIHIRTSQWNNTEISKLYFNNSALETNISFKGVVYFNPPLQWQFDYWSFLIGMVIMYSIYTSVALYLEKKRHA